MDVVVLSLAKKYTDDSIAGGGISAGKNCVINSITDISTGHRVEFQWTLDNGTVQTATMDVADAVQIAGITADAQNRILVEMADGTVYTTATIPTVPGYSPSAVAERVDAGAKITITDKTGTTTAIAEDGVSPEVSVVRNPQDTGVIITITDAEGEHTATVNDGSVSASMPYANVTGKPQINSVELNGNKSLADLGINIPTRNSQLLNDSNFITASDLPTIDNALSAVSSNPVTNSAITTEIRATQSTLNDTIIDVGANTDAITILNGNATVNGSVQKQIQDALANLDRLTKQIVAELPPVSSAVENVIYLIPNQAGTAYEQWTIVDDGQGGKVYAQLGSTDTDLSGYYTSAQVDSLLGDKQATLTGAATSVASLNLSTNRAVVSDANGKIAASSITATELEALDDVTGNIQDQINGKEDTLTWDSAPTNASTNPVTSGGVYTALQGKQDTLTFDSVPTALSNNPVTSAGIKTAIDAKQDTFQVEELPIASSTYEDVILQYIGAETGGLVNGAFYRCELNSSTATYEWNEFVPFDVPEKTSDLTNDSNFVSDADYVHTDNNYDDTAKAAVDALGTASTKDYTDIVRPGSHDLVEAGSVYSAITEAVSDIQDVIPSDASASNKLVTENIGWADNAGAHNSIYRGKYLGSSVTVEQYAQISAGTFEDLYIGDYWTIGDINYRIAGFDYWLHSGDTECTTHHVVLVPDTGFYNASMNSSSVTTGGYVGSDMYTSNLADAKTMINTAFGSAHILSHRELFTSSVSSDGKANDWAWVDSTVDLMNECMVYGYSIWGSHPGYETGIDKSQLPLFAMSPNRIINRSMAWWLRSIVSASRFALVGHNGSANFNAASTALGVRPTFAIK